MRLGGLTDELITDAEVQGQLRVDLKVILGVEEVAWLLERVGDVIVDPGVVDFTQEKIGETQTGSRLIVGIAREIASEIKLPTRIGRLENAVTHLRLVFGAKLQGVPAFDHAQSLDEVNKIRNFLAGLEPAALKLVMPVTVKLGKPPFSGKNGIPGRPICWATLPEASYCRRSLRSACTRCELH